MLPPLEGFLEEPAPLEKGQMRGQRKIIPNRPQMDTLFKRKSSPKKKVNLKSASKKPIVINRPTRPPRSGLALNGGPSQIQTDVNNFSNLAIPLAAVWY